MTIALLDAATPSDDAENAVLEEPAVAAERGYLSKGSTCYTSHFI